MINGIGSCNSYMTCMQAMRARPDPADMFNKVDSDGSGGVSQSELETLVEDLSGKTGNEIDTADALSTYDTDGDGELGEAELRSFMEANMKPPQGMMGMGRGRGPGGFFDEMDSDSSSGISQSELDTWAEAMSEKTGNSIDTTDAVSAYDTDGDGELSNDELKSFMDASGIKPPPPPPPPPRSEGMMNGFGSVGESSSTTAESILSAYDSDDDGSLNIDELEEYLENNDESSIVQMMLQAISAYSMNFGSFNGYSSVDFSV